MVLAHTYAGKVSLDFDLEKVIQWEEKGQVSQEDEGMVTGY